MYKRLLNAFGLVAIAFTAILASCNLAELQSQNTIAAQPENTTVAPAENPTSSQPPKNNTVESISANAPQIDCAKAVNTPELKYCSQLSYQAADKQLNQAYQKVTSSIKGEQKQLLTTAQQAWIKFRDNNCNFETYPSRDGTGYEIFRNGCLERLTKQRTKDLQDYLSNR